MRVLFLSATPGLFVEGKIGGWIASLEDIIHNYLFDRVELGLVFETKDKTLSKEKKNNTTYYPISTNINLLNKIKCYSNANERWNILKPYILNTVVDFNPDIIHCFGSEWPYAAIVDDVNIPVIVHIQGFLNIINLSTSFVVSRAERSRANLFRPKELIRSITSARNDKSCDEFEQTLMKANRYFMGRTEWDKNIVKYFSPGSKYYCVQEAIRPEIYYASRRWVSYT